MAALLVFITQTKVVAHTLLMSTLHALTILEIINQHASEAVKESTLQ
jgi:hypothetical protein